MNAKLMLTVAILLAGAWFTAAEAAEEHNLFAPLNSTQTYLMTNDGEFVHTWTSSSRPGLSVYLLEDGTLVRTANSANSAFNVGGSGGGVEMLDWESNVVWTFDYSSPVYCLHHDIEVLPNGNILMIAWELKTESEAIAAGRDPSLLDDGELWPDHVIEVRPEGDSGGTIVWEWHVWDHLVQDYDPSKPNYGRVEDHPELIDLNYTRRRASADWNHINSIDYNAELDQIVLSVHDFNEIWIIDHSTTTEEAAGHSGGVRGRGGDLLYRWGNPQAYGAGTMADQQLFAQHDAEWIADGLPGAGNILIFNNGLGRQGSEYSTIDEIVPPVLPDGSYGSSLPFGPEAPVWTYAANPTDEFFAERISGSQRLASGNTLICDGPAGRFFEVTPNGDTVWEYEHGSDVFRVERMGATESSYSYWVEIAANLSGKYGSQWRTDLAIRNTSAAEAAIELVLHAGGTQHSLDSVIAGSNQAVFEDVVALLGVTGKGALEIRSNQPLLAVARIFNQDDKGTQGQFVDACTSEEGLESGESALLLGLRQLDDTFRTNLSATNTSSSTGAVDVELFDTDGSLLATYALVVEPSEMVQDLEPFKERAGRPSLGWGFARISVLSGSGILSSATVIDSRTNDATTIAMKP